MLQNAYREIGKLGLQPFPMFERRGDLAHSSKIFCVLYNLSV